MRRKSKAKTLLSVRIDPKDLAALKKLGEEAKPVPASLNQMIGAAVAEYVYHHAPMVGVVEKVSDRRPSKLIAKVTRD